MNDQIKKLLNQFTEEDHRAAKEYVDRVLETEARKKWKIKKAMEANLPASLQLNRLPHSGNPGKPSVSPHPNTDVKRVIDWVNEILKLPEAEARQEVIEYSKQHSDDTSSR